MRASNTRCVGPQFQKSGASVAVLYCRAALKPEKPEACRSAGPSRQGLLIEAKQARLQGLGRGPGGRGPGL